MPHSFEKVVLGLSIPYFRPFNTENKNWLDSNRGSLVSQPLPYLIHLCTFVYTGTFSPHLPSRNQTQIVGIEGEHADHFAVNTALPFELSLMFIFFSVSKFYYRAWVDGLNKFQNRVPIRIWNILLVKASHVTCSIQSECFISEHSNNCTLKIVWHLL